MKNKRKVAAADLPQLPPGADGCLGYYRGWLCIVTEGASEAGSSEARTMRWWPVEKMARFEATSFLGCSVTLIDQTEGLYLDEEGNVHRLKEKSQTKPIREERVERQDRVGRQTSASSLGPDCEAGGEPCARETSETLDNKGREASGWILNGVPKEGFFGFRNFRQFERTRREIRLPCDLLNDIRFRQLPDACKAHLICLLLLCARMDNLLPNRPVRLEQWMGATDPLDLSALSDFLEVANVESASRDDRFANRRVPDSVRAAVLMRDGARCRNCHRAIDLEIDHIVPVSRGGRTEESNLQTLCRRCNRRKWRKIVPRL